MIADRLSSLELSKSKMFRMFQVQTYSRLRAWVFFVRRVPQHGGGGLGSRG